MITIRCILMDREKYNLSDDIVCYCISETLEVISEKQKRPLLTAVYP